MYQIGLYFVTLFALAFGAGEVTFIAAPPTIKFVGNEPVDASLLKEIFSASLGFTTSGSSEWSGMRVLNPFHYAEAVVCLVVDGVKTLDKVNGHQFPLNTNEEEEVTWRALKHRVWERFFGMNSSLVRIDLADAENIVSPVDTVHTAFGDIEINPAPLASHALDLNETEARNFLVQLAFLKGIAQKVRSGAISRDGLPDVYWFVLSGLHHVVDYHGSHSPAALEAQQLLNSFIQNELNAFQDIYGDHVLLSVVTTDVSHTRQARSLMASDDDAPSLKPEDLNLSKDYGPDYPVIFNILLWFMVAFTFSILAVSIGIASMDPGRDSIIYRMTSNRMKKDN
ncbi:ATPase H(+)-transporting accessory protein 2 [Anabrus simplex]|uniref:ATPase H(+)-transporting accessory protein 2 n=1 Tax=Anabrus simplex TaxID=316456 RepID=UPI0034DD663C